MPFRHLPPEEVRRLRDELLAIFRGIPWQDRHASRLLKLQPGEDANHALTLLTQAGAQWHSHGAVSHGGVGFPNDADQPTWGFTVQTNAENGEVDLEMFHVGLLQLLEWEDRLAGDILPKATDPIDRLMYRSQAAFIGRQRAALEEELEHLP